MADDKLVLYGNSQWTSPYVFSAYVALKEKGLAFEMRLLDLGKGEAAAPPYRDDSLTARVPALVHGDFWLSESSAIDEYIEDAFPASRYPRLYPAGPRERARARQLQAWFRSDLMPLRTARSTAIIFYHLKASPLSGEAADDAEHLLRVAEQLVARCRPHPHAVSPHRRRRPRARTSACLCGNDLEAAERTRVR